MTTQTCPAPADAAALDVADLRAEVERLRDALRRRNEPPAHEGMAKLLTRSRRNNSNRVWRKVGYAVRCWQDAADQRDRALRALRAALPIVEYVSAGRGHVDTAPYPDAAARTANNLIRDALTGNPITP